MAIHLSVLLVLAGLTGIHSITTVSDVSVKAGGSISIPCLYGPSYTNHVKYLCKGYYWNSCSYAVKTNQPNTEKFSISDDTNQRIFNVTINSLTVEDNDYWCAVEIDGGADIRTYFHLDVSRDMSRLYVVPQQITGFNGGDVTIHCHHTSSGGMKWCRLGSSCVEEQSGSIDETTVTISTSTPNVFTVTMSGLRMNSNGWYWCATGDLQMPVHINVHEQILPTTVPDTTRQQVSDVVPGTDEEEQQGQFNNLKNLIIPLSLLIFIITVTLFIWWMLRRKKQAKGKSSSMTLAEQDIIYTDVWHSRKTSGQRTYAESDVDVIYSTVAPKKHEGTKG